MAGQGIKTCWVIFIVTCITYTHSQDGQTLEIGPEVTNSTDHPPDVPDWDPKGYLFFCLCMGRTGNQFDHFLGGLAFAKRLDRTLVVPPFRTYRNIRFTEWFKLKPLQAYHRVILAEDFMHHLAPAHWPPEQRLGMCAQLPSSSDAACEMKRGNPFKPFWDGLGIDFPKTENYYLSYSDTKEKWDRLYPATKYPVLAMRGAPARFPVQSAHRALQQHLQVSEHIAGEAQDYIHRFFPDGRFIGIHLRNGPDWANACQSADGLSSYMASPQCLEGTDRRVSVTMCFPDDKEIYRLLRKVVKETGVKNIFVATDRRPMIKDIEENLSAQQVHVHHADPHLPLVDMHILTQSQHFIGNCISSFSAYVKRARDLAHTPTSFWGFS